MLDAVNVASLALMTAVTLVLARDAVNDVVTIAMASLAALLLLRYRVEPTLLIAAGGLIGMFMPHF